ncbi:MAG: restriction endonuclease subunit S [Oceanipulchritudo sp.]
MSEVVVSGNIPEYWEKVTVGEVCKRGQGGVQTGPFGSQLHASDYVEVGVPSIMPVNIGDNRVVHQGIACITEADAQRLQKYRVKTGDIIYSRRGDVERRALIRKAEDGWLCGTGCLRVRFGKDVVDPEFASFQLGHPEVRNWIVRHAVGATMPNLNTQIMASVPFVLPPLPEQKAIAHILGTLDDKIELNRRMNETLEAMARALFKSWFVDFDPVRAKMDGRQPAGMDAETARLFPDRFVESELGPIPEGWGVAPLSKLIEILSGGTPKTSVDEYWNGNIPWYSVKDAPTEADVWVIQTEKSVTQIGIDNSAAKVLPENTTIISARGTVGKLALVGVPMAMNQSCYGIRGISGVDTFYIYFLLKEANGELQQRTHGTVFDTITRQTFDTLNAIISPEKITEMFGSQAGNLLSRIKLNLIESRTLSALRDALLPKLLSGELSVGEAEEMAS